MSRNSTNLNTQVSDIQLSSESMSSQNHASNDLSSQHSGCVVQDYGISASMQTPQQLALHLSTSLDSLLLVHSPNQPKVIYLESFDASPISSDHNSQLVSFVHPMQTRLKFGVISRKDYSSFVVSASTPIVGDSPLYHDVVF